MRKEHFLVLIAVLSSGCLGASGTDPGPLHIAEHRTECPIETIDGDGCEPNIDMVSAEPALPEGQLCVNAWPGAGEGENYSLWDLRDEQSNAFAYHTMTGLPASHLIGVTRATVDGEPIGPFGWTVEGREAWVPQPGAMWWQNEQIDHRFQLIPIHHDTDIPRFQNAETRVVFNPGDPSSDPFRVYVGFDDDGETYWFGGTIADYIIHTPEGNVTLRMSNHIWGQDGEYIGPPRILGVGPSAPPGTEEVFEDPDC